MVRVKQESYGRYSNESLRTLTHVTVKVGRWTDEASFHVLERPLQPLVQQRDVRVPFFGGTVVYIYQ